jgi:hypothetical protein
VSEHASEYISRSYRPYSVCTIGWNMAGTLVGVNNQCPLTPAFHDHNFGFRIL